jgi:hypothetical protein
VCAFLPRILHCLKFLRFPKIYRAEQFDGRTDIMSKGDESPAPKIVDRSTFHAQLDALRVREKAHTHEGDDIAAARRRLPMVEVDGAIALTGPRGPVTLLDAFEGRRQVIAYYFMWQKGHPAPEQCEGCTWVTTQVRELSYLHSRSVTFAVICQGPYDESARYRDFMGWEMPWYSAQGRSLDSLLTGRHVGRMHIVCYLRQDNKLYGEPRPLRRTSASLHIFVDDNEALLRRADRQPLQSCESQVQKSRSATLSRSL